MSFAPALPLTYFASKARMVLLLLGCLGFVALGLWLALDAETIAASKGDNPGKIRLIGYVCTLFFGAGILVAIKGIFVEMKVFSLSAEGITIFSNFGSASTLTPWTTIDHFDIVIQKVQRTKIKYIGIFLKDYAPYYATLGPARVKLAQFNQDLFGTPVILNTRAVAVDQQALLGWLKEYLAQQGSA